MDYYREGGTTPHLRFFFFFFFFFFLRSPALGWLSKYYEYTIAKQNEYTVAKQNGGGAEWVELFITLTKGMGEPTYGLLLSLIASWRSRLVQRVLHRSSSLDARGCSAATLSQ